MHFIGENWEMIKQTIHTEYDLTNISYNTWIEPLQFYDVKDDTVYIQIPTGQAHALNYISNKYSNYFKVTISEMMDHDYDISFILEKEKAADTDTDLKSPSSNINNINYEQANLNPKYKFDTFIVGNNNKFAHSACLAVAESRPSFPSADSLQWFRQTALLSAARCQSCCAALPGCNL